mgnify:CR=1 FL=1
MATSNRGPTRSRQDDTGDRTLSRYDLLLVVIPAVFALGLVVTQVSALSASTVLGAASLVGALAVADGLFVNPPQQ